jgi:hypothetical protein
MLEQGKVIRIPLKSLHFKKMEIDKNPENWGRQLPPSFPTHRSAKCKKFQSSS